MAGFSDVLAEFKNASPGEKALMIVAIIAVAGAGIYIYKQRQAASTAGTGGTLVPIGSDAGSGDTSSGTTGTTDTGSTGTTSTGSTNGTGTGSSTGSTSGTTIGSSSGSSTGSSSSSTHANGSTFLGPTGVLHYVSTGTETLSQIAAKFGSGTWNSIYAIPDNIKLFGKMNSTSAASYKPKAGQVITLAPNSKIPGSSSASSSSSSSSSSATRTVVNGNSNSATSGTWVTVSKGGTLWGLAQQYYGNGATWQRIAQANKISNPSSLQVGQKVFIPK